MPPAAQSLIGWAHLFTGRPWDHDVRQYYYRYRWYDPHAGRWTALDPIGYAGGMVQYAYCGGNPVNFVDPWGFAPLECEAMWQAMSSERKVVEAKALGLAREVEFVSDGAKCARNAKKAFKWAKKIAGRAAIVFTIYDGVVTYESGGLDAAGNSVTGLDLVPIVTGPPVEALEQTIENSEAGRMLSDRYHGDDAP